MKKELSKEEIIEQYIKSGEIMTEEREKGKYRRYNQEVNKNIKITKYLSCHLEIAKEVFPILLGEKNEYTRYLVSINCFQLGIYIKRAEEVLEKISIKSKEPITRFDAEMALKRWKNRDKNYIIYYNEEP